MQAWEKAFLPAGGENKNITETDKFWEFGL